MSCSISKVYMEAAQRDHLHIVQWLLSEDPEIEALLDTTFDMPEEKTTLVIKWLAEQYAWKDEDKGMWLVDSMPTAARCANMELLQYLHEHQLANFTLSMLDYAVMGGSVDAAKWLHARGIGSEDEDLVFIAVESLKLEMVHWVLETFPELPTTTDAMDFAASNSLEIVRCLHENRSEGCTTAAMDNAASRGKLNIVQFLHENRPEGCTANAMSSAAAHGHLDMVKFLHSHRTEGILSDAMNQAAANGHLEIVKFLHELQPDACVATALMHGARYGHLSVVQWLYEHRANDFSIATAMNKAAENGHRDVVAYLALHYQPDFDDSQVKRAVKCNHISLVQWMLGNVSEKDEFFFQLRLDNVFNREIQRWHERVRSYGRPTYE